MRDDDDGDGDETQEKASRPTSSAPEEECSGPTPSALSPLLVVPATSISVSGVKCALSENPPNPPNLKNEGHSTPASHGWGCGSSGFTGP